MKIDIRLLRDFTINSLFYNLNTGRVEDMTGRGLEDLANSELSFPSTTYINLSLYFIYLH
jgi:tRNA nucleotidyltransferase/poly(A) polymerase